jgi:CheY-like chemotaxis protein
MVFVDVLMPGMDGITTARAIRELYSDTGYLPCLLAVTGSFCDAAAVAVFDGMLSKPFVIEELSLAIRNAPRSRDKRQEL